MVHILLCRSVVLTRPPSPSPRAPSPFFRIYILQPLHLSLLLLCLVVVVVGVMVLVLLLLVPSTLGCSEATPILPLLHCRPCLSPAALFGSSPLSSRCLFVYLFSCHVFVWCASVYYSKTCWLSPYLHSTIVVQPEYCCR